MKKVIEYLFYTFSISWGIWGIALLAQAEIIPPFLRFISNIAVLGPFIAYLIMIKKDGKSIKENLKKEYKEKAPKWTYYYAVILPFILSSVAYIFYVLMNDVSFELGLSVQMIVPVALIILLTGGPLEEFGWRGFMLPNIRNEYGIVVSALIVGLVHGIWHLPLHFLEGTVQINIPIYEFIIITILLSMSYSFIYEHTKNIKPMIVLHWMSNLSSAIFMYWVDGYGRYTLLVLTIIMNIVLIILLNRKEKVTT